MFINKRLCWGIISSFTPQPVSSSDSEANDCAAGSEAEDDEDAVVPRKAYSGSEVDSDSGSEDRGGGGGSGGGGIKRKAQAAKVIAKL